jgi:23S rRNA (cytosine1962-C5)-methyltransferase
VLGLGVADVEVTAKGLRRLQTGHPWIFASDLRALPTTPHGAGVVVVRGPQGERLGEGFFNPRSKLSVRLVTRGEVALSAELLGERLRRAAHLRERVAAGFEAFRVVHSEADGLPGLTVDRYGDVLVLQQHAAALEAFTETIVSVLTDLYKPQGILARNDSPLRALEGLPQEVRVLAGTVPERVLFTEGEVTLSAAPYTGQKTGAFLDQRENHLVAGEHARGRALDVFSYHGGFALQLARRAETVTAVDSSAAALAVLEASAARNGLPLTTRRGDAFDVLRGLVAAGERFDTIVLDPPAFAKGRAQIPQALAGYREINLQALKLLGVGGRLFSASCSHFISETAFLETLASAAQDAGRLVRLLTQRGAAGCHPQLLALPETRYLTFVGLEVVELLER